MEMRSRFCGLFCAAVGLVACASPAADDGRAPDVAEATADALDWGTSYDGWTQSPGGWVCGDDLYARWHNDFIRDYGDTTRGGGACLVIQSWYGASDDDTCTRYAVGVYGAGAYGYSYGDQCYLRPGSQSQFCAVTGSAYPGVGVGPSSDASADFRALTEAANMSPDSDVWRVLGCMTKAAGPSKDCGSTDPSLYMKTLADAPWYGTDTYSFCPY